MIRSMDYENDKGNIRVRPVVIPSENKKQQPELAYISIFTTTSKVNINRDDIAEVIEILEAVKEQYLDRQPLK